MRYIVLLLPLFLLACEQDVSNPDWPEHEEKLVVTGFVRLQNDSMFTYCRVSRTMPLGVQYRDEDAIINNADILLRHDNGALPVPYHPTASNNPWVPSFDYTAVNARPLSETFQITVRSGQHQAFANQTIPDAPLSFESVALETHPTDTWMQQLRYTMRLPEQPVDYVCVFEIRPQGSVEWIEYMTVDLYIPRDAFGRTFSGAQRVYFDPMAMIWSKRYRLIAASPEYREYNTAVANGRWGSGGDPFEPDSKNPRFNVTGDGIGFFWVELVGEPIAIP